MARSSQTTTQKIVSARGKKYNFTKKSGHIYIYIEFVNGGLSASPWPWILIMFIYVSCGLGQHLIREKHGKPVALFGDK